MKTVNISPGHFGIGTGASDCIDEVTHAIKVSKRVTEILKASGVKVNYIEDNKSKTKAENLNWLVKTHNSFKDALLDVSVHFNSSGSRVHKDIGVEVLIAKESNKKIASVLSKGISDASGMINRGVKIRKELAFLNGTNKPAVLLEICFVNSSVDVKKYKDNFEAICINIAKAICEHVGVKFLSPVVIAPKDAEKSMNDRARALINKAVANGTFTGNHKPELYNREQLFKYIVTLGERLMK